MTASLPMYWRDETAEAWRGFWKHIQDAAAEEGLALPELSDPENIGEDLMSHWLDPDLSLSMTCGYPFRAALKDRVNYVGTFDFGLRDTRPGHYFSHVICGVERSDLDGGLTLAFSASDSQSGWACVSDPEPKNPQLTFSDVLETGSHAASLAAVAEGRADIAYIDAVTWRFLERHDPNAARVRLIGQTGQTPGLPLITRAGGPVQALQGALSKACRALSGAQSDALGGLIGFTVFDSADYLAVPTYPPRIA